MKRYVIGTLVAGACLFLLGYLMYAIVLPNPKFAQGLAAAAANKATPSLPPIIAAELLCGLLLTYVLTNSGATASLGKAAVAAAITGTLVVLANSLIALGTTEMITVQGVVYLAVTWAIRWAIAGAVLALIAPKQQPIAP